MVFARWWNISISGDIKVMTSLLHFGKILSMFSIKIVRSIFASSMQGVDPFRVRIILDTIVAKLTQSSEEVKKMTARRNCGLAATCEMMCTPNCKNGCYIKENYQIGIKNCEVTVRQHNNKNIGVVCAPILTFSFTLKKDVSGQRPKSLFEKYFFQYKLKSETTPISLLLCYLTVTSQFLISFHSEM